MMKRLTAFAAVLCFSMHTYAGEASEPKVSAEQIAVWIKQLGEANFAARNAAEAKLAEAGSAIEAALIPLKDSKDSEIRMRAGRLLTTIAVERIVRAAENVVNDAKSAEGNLVIAMPDRTVQARVKCLADGKHFRIEETCLDGPNKTKITIVADGENIWVENATQDGKKSVAKYSIQKYEEALGGKLRNPLDQVGDLRFFAFNDPSVEKLGDEEVIAMDGALKPGASGEAHPWSMLASILNYNSQIRMHFLKKNSMLRKMEIVNLDGTTVVEIYNVKLGTAFGEKEFVYTPPADAEVKEMKSSEMRLYEGWALPYSRLKK